MAKINIEKLEVYANIGDFEYEKKMRQKFLISIEMETDFSRVAKTDDLNDTIDYVKVINICKEEMANPTDLIETMVVSLAEKIKTSFEKISSISVCIEKPEAQLNLIVDSVSVSHQIS